MATGYLGGTLTRGEGWLTRRAPPALRKALARLSPEGVPAAVPPERAVVYTVLAQRILARRCTDCHGGTIARGALRLDTPEAIRKGGHGAVIAAGRPESSELMRRIWLPASNPKAMPGGPGVRGSTSAEVALRERTARDAGSAEP